MKVSEVLIDGDEIVYKIGFTGQVSQFSIIGPGGPTGCQTKMKDHAYEDIGIDEDGIYDLSKEWIQLPWEIVKRRIDYFIRYTQDLVRCNTYRVFLSGSDNFRKKVATLLPYKGNRSPDGRPLYFQEIRNYLFEEYFAETQEHLEADDQLGIAHMEKRDRKSNSVLCTQDKDLKMIPGVYFNPWKPNNGMHTITLEEANRNFFLQLLQGDSTDNIPGIVGIGPVMARKLIPEGLSTSEMSSIVYEAYRQVIEDPGKNRRLSFQYDTGAHKDLNSVINEIAGLLWIWRDNSGVHLYEYQ
jgi:hypothetical protein